MHILAQSLLKEWNSADFWIGKIDDLENEEICELIRFMMLPISNNTIECLLIFVSDAMGLLVCPCRGYNVLRCAVVLAVRERVRGWRLFCHLSSIAEERDRWIHEKRRWEEHFILAPSSFHPHNPIHFIRFFSSTKEIERSTETTVSLYRYCILFHLSFTGETVICALNNG